MDSEFTLIPMGQSMKAIGRMTCSMGKARRPGQMVRGMKVITSKGKSMEEEPTFGLMVVFTKVSGWITRLRVTESTSGLMVDNTLELGRQIICMEKGSTLGKTAGNTKASTSMTRSMAMVCTSGQMAVGMRATGSMASSTETASIFYLMGQSK